MATLNVSITESVTLNGKNQGGTYSSFSNSSITQVEKRLINAKTGTELTLYKTADAIADGTAANLWDDDSVKYVRISNLAANSAYSFIRIQNANSDEFSYKLYGTESLLLYRHEATMDATAGAPISLGSGDNDIQLVTIKAISSDQAIELFIAATNEA